MDAECPVCFKRFASSQLERHVNKCLDNKDIGHVERDPNEAPGERDITNDISKVKVKHAFEALGMKLDSVAPARKIKNHSKPNTLKEGPTLTSLLIAEKKMKGYGIRESKANLTTVLSTESSKNQISEEDKSSHTLKCAEDKSVVEISERERETEKLVRESKLPLAHRLRPKTLAEYIGQDKLVGENGILRRMIESDSIPSFILWGSPGVGKTTLARIISNSTKSKFIELSGTDANSKKLKEAFASAELEFTSSGNRVILFLDEIHRFNKAVQDLLLPVIEKGIITVIGATTENPSFTLNNALLSRMHTFVLEKPSHTDLVKVINRGLFLINKTRRIVHGLNLLSLDKDAIDYIASICNGDSRATLNILESINAYISGIKFSAKSPIDLDTNIKQSNKIGVIKVDLQNIKSLIASRSFNITYDRQGESHYDAISAFHKSIRGSDPDAAIFYLTKMLTGGEDPMFIARRMIVIASEDVGLRDNLCLPFAIAAKDAVEFIGMPEGEIVLAHCAVRLAKASKSTKSYRALRAAQELFKTKPETLSIPIPFHLRNAPTKLMKELGYGDGYKYNPNYVNGRVEQPYLPKELSDIKFIDQQHLGTLKDPSINQTVYDSFNQEEKDYQRFKKRKKALLRNALDRGNSNCTESDHNIMSILNSGTDSFNSNNSHHTFDEFLTTVRDKIIENDILSENDNASDYENNFDRSYDEFLEEEDQPLYYHQ